MSFFFLFLFVSFCRNNGKKSHQSYVFVGNVQNDNGPMSLT